MTTCSSVDQGESLLGGIPLSRFIKKAAPSPGSDHGFRLAAAYLPGDLNTTFSPGFAVLSAAWPAPGRGPGSVPPPAPALAPCRRRAAPFVWFFSLETLPSEQQPRHCRPPTVAIAFCSCSPQPESGGKLWRKKSSNPSFIAHWPVFLHPPLVPSLRSLS